MEEGEWRVTVMRVRAGSGGGGGAGVGGCGNEKSREMCEWNDVRRSGVAQVHRHCR